MNRKLGVFTITRVVWLIFGGVMSAIVPALGRPLQQAPLNPEFVHYQRDKRAGKVALTSASGHYLGYRPSPHAPRLPLTGTSRITSDALPAYYDLRTTGRLTPVKNQGNCGSSWAFATYGAMESYLKPTETTDFSENNLKNLHGFDWGYGEGGNEWFSMAYLARWSGPVSEADDPYNPTSGYSPPDTSVNKHLQEAVLIPARTGPLDNAIIKQAVISNGAVYTSIFWADTYYNPSTYSYYYPGGSSNYTVCIIGWDDNYPAANFLSTPPGNGAFIIRSSWGADWGEHGYCYLSYYDGQIGHNNCQFHKVETTTNYMRNYGYDPLGWVGDIGYGDIDYIWGANVFTCAGNERLKAVGFYAVNINTTYEIAIYVNPAAGSPINADGPVATQAGTLTYPGYYSIPLTTPVTLTRGQRFSVAIKFTTPGYHFPLPIEYASPDYSSAATAVAGQSYYSDYGIDWSDMTGYIASANDCIKAFTGSETTSCQPDLQIRTSAESSYIGNDIHNATGALQTKSQSVGCGQTAAYYCRVQNDGVNADSFIVTGPASGSGWEVGYVDYATDSIITGAVTGAGWNTGVIAPGQYVVVLIRVVPTRKATGGTNKAVNLHTVSATDDSYVDVVKVVTTAATTCQPDLLLRTSAEASYLGDNMYNLSGSGQTKSQGVSAGQTAVYYCRVQNDGNTAESFTITGPAGSNGWAIGYGNYATNGVITGAVTGAGWTTGVIAPGQYMVIVIRVVPSSAAPPGTSKQVWLQARSQLDTQRTDLVQTITSATLTYKSDLLLRTSTEISYLGDNIYNTTGTGQTKGQSITADHTAAYYCRVQNDGNTAESFTVTGLPGSNGWAVGYVNYTTNSIITAAVTGAGWNTGVIAPGQYVVVVMRVVPASSVSIGTTKDVWLQAISTHDTTRLDVVKAVTTRQ